jgi:hypothetical protein
MALFDSAELLATIKNRGMIPANAGGWTDAELLKAASEEILTWHLPKLVEAKGEYLVKDQFLALSSDDAMFPAASYDVTYRAAAVRAVKLIQSGVNVDVDNLTMTNAQEAPLEELTPTKQAKLSMRRDQRGVPRFYAFRENRVELWPAPADALAVLWVKYHIRPSRIVLTSDCRQIVDIQEDTPGAGQITLMFGTPIGSALAGGVNQAKYDIVSYQDPFVIKAFDLESQSLMTNGVSSSMVIEKERLFLSDGIRGSDITLREGDWVCPAQQTPVPNIPSELHSAAALRAAAAACASRNPSLQAQLVREAAAKEAELMNGILAPRNKGSVKRLVQRRW